jgi:CRP-like cAMP-binding protein
MIAVRQWNVQGHSSRTFYQSTFTAFNYIMVETEILLQYGAVVKPVSQSEVIITEEQQSWNYYQLVNGSARAININENGREYLQYLVYPGDTFGEIPLFDEGKYAVTVIADEPSTIIKLPKEQFLKMLSDNDRLYPEFLRLFSERLRFKYFLLKEISNHNPERSIKNLIHYFKGSNKICKKCNKLKLTRQQMADMLGMRVETVIRSVRNLHNNGMLEIRKGKVFCYD